MNFSLSIRKVGKPQNVAIIKAKVFPNWSLWADGSQLALVLIKSEPKITFMSVNDKSTRAVELNGYSHVDTVDWTADSKSVYVVAQTTAEPTRSSKSSLQVISGCCWKATRTRASGAPFSHRINAT